MASDHSVGTRSELVGKHRCGQLNCSLTGRLLGTRDCNPMRRLIVVLCVFNRGDELQNSSSDIVVGSSMHRIYMRERRAFRRLRIAALF